MPGYTSHLDEESPKTPVVKLFLVIIIVTFGAEILIMQLLPIFSITTLDNLQIALLDALFLSIIVCIVILPLLLFYQRRIQASQDRLAQQLQALNQHASVSITDAKGQIIYANSMFCEITGYRLQELYGQDHRIINSGHHPKEFFAQMWSTLGQGNIWQGDLCNRNKQGEHYWVRTTIVPITNNAGNTTKYISMRTDITSQKLLEHAALKSEEWLHTIMDNMGDGIYTLDSEGHLTYFNPEAERLLGWQLKELKGKLLHDAIHHHRPDGQKLTLAECPITSAMKNKQIYRSENEVFFNKNGLALPVSVTGAPLLDEDQVIGSVVTFRDARVQQQIQTKLIEAKEAAEETARIKADFLSTMSHEIRTPLNGVIGMTDLLLDTAMNEEQLEFANTIKISANALLSIINDILDFSKIEAGRLEIEKIEFSLQHVLEGSVDLVASKAYEKGLSLMSFVDPAIPNLLIGDPARLRQILLNFLSNAIKFTPTGDIVARAKLETRDNKQVRIRLEVSDNGIGITRETQRRLFQPFAQADSSTTRKYGGTGLGLSICKRLAELMDGEIGMESHEGQGSVFWISIPLTVNVTESVEEIPSTQGVVASDIKGHPSLPQPSVRGKRLLLAGDKAGNRALYLMYLYAWGLRVDVAESLLEICQLINDAKTAGDEYMALLLTQPLPDSDLLHTISTVHKEPGLQSFPILVCQALVDLSLKNTLIDLGATAVLVKPVKQSALFDAIISLLNLDGLAKVEPELIPPTERVAVPLPINHAQAQQRLILLAEDNLVNQQVALHVLNKMGYIVHIANNGQEALSAMHNLSYSLILMDCQMPVMDGFEATHIIRHREAESKQHIPIVAMTANAMQGDRERCLAAGMDDYVTKPIDIENLQTILSNWLPPDPTSAETNTTEVNASAADDAQKNLGAVIELTRLHDLFGDDDEVIAELLDVFLGSLKQLREKLLRAIAEQKPTIKSLAHELKGSAANVGAMRLSRHSAKLEQLVSTNQWPAINEYWQVIDEEIHQIILFIKNMGTH
jgi:PAS domain S-box-containing protein